MCEEVFERSMVPKIIDVSQKKTLADSLVRARSIHSRQEVQCGRQSRRAQRQHSSRHSGHIYLLPLLLLSPPLAVAVAADVTAVVAAAAGCCCGCYYYCCCWLLATTAKRRLKRRRQLAWCERRVRWGGRGGRWVEAAILMRRLAGFLFFVGLPTRAMKTDLAGGFIPKSQRGGTLEKNN